PRVDSNCLFAKDMLAGIEGLFDVVVVESVWGSNIDDINARILIHFIRISESMLYMFFLDKGTECFFIWICGSINFAVDFVQSISHIMCNPASTNNSPIKCFHDYYLS